MRLYRQETFYSMDDENFIRVLNNIFDLYKEQGSSDVFRVIYKNFCNEVREMLDITKVVGFAPYMEEPKVAIFIYDKEATDNNFYEQKFDEERNLCYIEVEEEGE